MDPVHRALLAVLCVFALSLFAEDEPYLVRDLPGAVLEDSLSTNAEFWTTVGNMTWFSPAPKQFEAREVWRTDGTPAGTVQVTHHDAPRSNTDRVATYIGMVGTRLIYNTQDEGGDGVYALDVTGGEPVLLRRNAIIVRRGVTFNGVLYFSVSSDYSSAAMWRTDGTPAGTRAVSLGASVPVFSRWRDGRLYPVGGTMLYLGRSQYGEGLHRTDGTTDGTALLWPLPPDGSSGARGVFADGSKFFASILGGQLLISDGTRTGTRVIDQPLPSLRELGGVKGKMLFVDGSWPPQLWVTDGTNDGTRRFDLIGNAPSSTMVYAGGVAGGKVFFVVERDDVLTLFATDGDTATEIMTLEPGAFTDFSYDRPGFAFGDRFVFGHDDGIHGVEPWVTDGTRQGTHLLVDIEPGPGSSFLKRIGFARPDGLLLGARSSGSGIEPWFTDGTAERTWLLANIRPDGPVHSSSPSLFRTDGQRLFFLAALPGGSAAGVSDGSSLGTFATVVAVRGDVTDAVAVGGHYFLRARELPYAARLPLTATDATVSGTTIVHPRTSGSFHSFRNGVIFVGLDDANVEAAWFSDGTLGGTRMLPRVGGGDTRPMRVFSTGNIAWITRGPRIWRTDGSEAGTVELPAHPRRTGNIGSITRVGDAYWFIEEWTGQDGNGPNVWRTDNSPAGMHIVKAFDPTVRMTQPHSLVGSGTLAFFFFGHVLYRSSGTEAGTYPLPVNAAVGDCGAAAAMLGDTLVVLGRRAGRGYGLWRTDGSIAGTIELYSTTTSVGPCILKPAVLGTSVYFAGWDATHGWEPWVSDGTVAGTHMLADLEPLPCSSVPWEFTTVGPRVFFSASSPMHGRELWAVGGDEPPSRRHSVRW